MSHEQEDLYVIPHNYTDNGKILGIVETQSVYTAAIWFLPMSYIVFWLLPFSLNVRIGLFIIFVVPPTAIALVGIGSETLFDFLTFVYKYYKRAKFYHYEK